MKKHLTFRWFYPTDNSPKRFLIQSFLFVILFFQVLPILAQISSGKVTDEQGDPLIGATVKISETAVGTVTDTKGQFTLQAEAGAKLIVSYMGYISQEVLAGANITIIMVEDATSLREVVVTAEHRTVSAQKVPITMDLVSGNELAKLGVTDMYQLQNLTPSLGLSQNSIFNQVFIRGVGSNEGPSELNDQAVTMNIDGEYLNRPVGLNASLFDLERMEVLKGPQGTLYGRNSTGGTINIIAAKPKLGKTEGDVGVQYGNYNALKTNVAVNVPIGQKAAVRGAFMSDKHDGYRQSNGDPAEGGYTGELDNGKVWGARLGVLVKPTERFSIYVAGDLTKLDQLAPGQYGVNLSGETDLIGSPPKDWTTVLPENFDVGNAGFQKLDQKAIRGSLGYEFGKTKLTYTGGARNLEQHGYLPLNGYIPETASFDRNENYRTQSHELRINGESESLIWQAGLFYGNEDQDNKGGLMLVAASRAFGGQIPYISYFDLQVNSNTTGIFSQATYNFNPKFAFTGGLRYTIDKKSLGGSVIDEGPFGPPGTPAYFYPNGPKPGDPGTGPIPGAGSGDWNQVTWLANIEYKPSAASMLFAKASTGYKAGGFTLIGEYDAEYLTAFEIGSKNMLAENRLKLNLSTFYYNYTDQQIFVFIDQSLGAQVQNAGASRYYGVEVEGIYLVTPNDQINFNVNYLNAKFTELTTPVNTVGAPSVVQDLSGNIPTQAPTWVLVGGYHHFFTVGKGTLDVGLNSMFKSSYYLQTTNFAMDKQDSYTKTDFTVNFTTGNEKWDFGAFVYNIEDNRIVNYAAFIGDNINDYNFLFGNPRLMGMKAAFHF